MPIPSKKKYTAEEFFKLVPETNQLCELMKGEIVAQAAPGITHQRIVGGVFSELRSFIKRKGGKCESFVAPADVVLDDENVVQPDVFVVCDPDKVGDKRVSGAPDLVIEVVSSNRADDYVRKLGLYANAGVREYWIVDIESKRTLTYLFNENTSINIYTFEQPIPVDIYGGELTVTIADFM